MLHRIAMMRNRGGFLNLVFLDPGGNPFAFLQGVDGVWHPTKAEAPGPTQIPAQTTFSAVLGVDFFGLLALDQKGSLWSTTQDAEGNWNPNGFSLLPNALLPNGQALSFADFGACQVAGFPVLVAAGGSGPAPNVYAQVGVLAQGGLTQPAPIGGEYLSKGSVAAIGIDPNGVSTAVVVGSSTLAGWPPFWCFTSVDGVNWLAAGTPQETPFGVNLAALVSGNPNGTLQAILLQNGTPYLIWDASGNGSNWVLFQNQNNGQLPNPDGRQFSMMAAARGNGGNLQVVGISNGLPDLIWQGAGGDWSPYANPQGQGMQLPDANPMNALLDLAMGTGNQGFLQVGYIGQDGSIYVNWQDQDGNWGWYGPLP